MGVGEVVGSMYVGDVSAFTHSFRVRLQVSSVSVMRAEGIERGCAKLFVPAKVPSSW